MITQNQTKKERKKILLVEYRKDISPLFGEYDKKCKEYKEKKCKEYLKKISILDKEYYNKCKEIDNEGEGDEIINKPIGDEVLKC